MARKRLDKKTAVYTPHSGTTVAINYSKARRILEVEYTGGKTYQYYKVEPEVWEEYKQTVLLGGSSGIFVNTRVKPYYHDYFEV